MKTSLRSAGIVVVIILVGLLAACTASSAPASTTGMTPATIPPLPPTVTLPAPYTPTPGLVEVALRTAEDSPYKAFFAVYNAAGEVVYQTTGSLEREYKLHLPPGEYRWTANAPIPTQPVGCYNIFENYGFSQDGRFSAIKDPIQIEIRIGFRLFLCTTTPEGT